MKEKMRESEIQLNRTYRTRSDKEVILYKKVGNRIHFAVEDQVMDCDLRGRIGDIPSDFDLFEYNPYKDFLIDEKVLVWNKGTKKTRAYFCDYHEGKPRTFRGGQTSWTAKSTIHWKHCEKLND